MLRVADHFERTDPGRARRVNEDSFFARAPLFAVADGVGGAQAGEVASHLAVQVIEQGLPERGGSVEERLRDLVEEANARINALSRTDEQRAGMASTLTVAYVGEHELSVAHVGDSRLYRLRDGAFERLTDDHSLVEELVRQGKLTPREADEHPQRSIITRALGLEAGVQTDSHTWPARHGDVYLLCSDGLTSMVPEERVAEMLGRGAPLPDAGRALVDAANAAGGRDNITVVLFRLEDVGAGAPSGETTEHDAVPAAATGREEPGAASAAAAAASAAGPATAAGGATAREDERGVDRAAAVTDAPAEPARRREPRAPRSPRKSAEAPRRRRRRLRVPTGLLLSLFFLFVIAVSGWYASQTVYFVGSDDGFVTVYRGLPYDLPAGLDLYSVNYTSGVPVSTLAGPQRTLVTEHKLRSRDDAHELVRQMETGELGAS